MTGGLSGVARRVHLRLSIRGVLIAGFAAVFGLWVLSSYELVRRLLVASRDTRQVITDPQAGYFGTPVDDHSLTPGDRPRIGPTHFDEWLSRSIPRA